MLSLAIVQSHATQFDDPLFRFLEAEKAFRLQVFYTTKGDAFRPFDPEIDLYPQWNQNHERGYLFHVYPHRLSSRIRTSLALVLERPDLIIVSGWRSFDNFLVLLLARLFGIPLGLRADNCPSREGCFLSGVLKRSIRRLIMGLFSTGHPVGSLAEKYMTESGLDAQRIFRFPYVVDEQFLTERHRQAQTERSAMRLQYGIDSNDLVIIGVTKLVEREDPLTLVRAFAASCGSDPKTHLILVGDGKLRHEIRNLVKNEELETVHLTGYVPYSRLPFLFALADILVHPAQHESWGVTVNEALVCGLPVIAADSVGCATDLIQPGVNGFIFPAGNSAALATLLTTLRTKPGVLATLKENCGESERLERFRYPAVRDSLLEALRFASGNNYSPEIIQRIVR